MLLRIPFRPTLLALLLAGAAAPAQAVAPALEVEVHKIELEHEPVYDVNASGAVLATPFAVWKILTNYDRMAEFVPDMHSSHVLSRSGNEAIVEQYGVARFLFVKHDIHLVVHVREVPMASIDISLVSGDMKVYACRWELYLVPETGGTRIAYSGHLVPKFYVPGMFGEHLIKNDIAHMMRAVLERLDRPEHAG